MRNSRGLEDRQTGLGATASTLRGDKAKFHNMFVLTTTVIQMAFLATALVAGVLFALRLRGQ